jgi:hypothetical protein
MLMEMATAMAMLMEMATAMAMTMEIAGKFNFRRVLRLTHFQTTTTMEMEVRYLRERFQLLSPHSTMELLRGCHFLMLVQGQMHSTL